MKELDEMIEKLEKIKKLLEEIKGLPSYIPDWTWRPYQPYDPYPCYPYWYTSTYASTIGDLPPNYIKTIGT